MRITSSHSSHTHCVMSTIDLCLFISALLDCHHFSNFIICYTMSIGVVSNWITKLHNYTNLKIKRILNIIRFHDFVDSTY